MTTVQRRSSKPRSERRGNRLIFSNPAYNRYRPLFVSRYHNNDTAAFVPEQWAAEGVRVLTEQMIYGALVHRDFDPAVAQYGEVIHTRKPAELTAKRKQNDLDNLQTSDVSATDIEVRLNQRAYTSFVIGDGERSKSFQDLVNVYLIPGMRGCSRFVDQVLAGQVYQFLGNAGGQLGGLTKINGHDYLIDTRGVMNANKVDLEGRWLGLADPAETLLQKNELFKSAEKIGDQGGALRDALLGRVGGFNTFLELNTPSVRNALQTGTTATVDGATLAGATSLDVGTGEAAGAGIVAGTYITIAGDMTPLRVTAVSTDTLTLSRPLRSNVANGAVVTAYAVSVLVNQASSVPAAQSHASAASGYPANWMKEIVYDGTGDPQVGQLVSFKTSGGSVLTKEYAVVQVDTAAKTFLLDQPLDAAIDNNAVVCLGPDGDYNFAFKREALTLVNRPLAGPIAGTGARSAAANFENISLRVTMTYDGVAEGTRVTCTMLFGTKVLDVDQGAVMLT